MIVVEVADEFLESVSKQDRSVFSVHMGSVRIEFLSYTALDLGRVLVFIDFTYVTNN